MPLQVSTSRSSTIHDTLFFQLAIKWSDKTPGLVNVLVQGVDNYPSESNLILQFEQLDHVSPLPFYHVLIITIVEIEVFSEK